MATAPIGAVVTIAPYDFSGDGPGPTEGDYLVWQGGSVYHILEARETRRRGRFRLICRKVAAADIDPAAPVYSIEWSRRDRRR